MVTACHDRGIVHKDVKDENLVVDLDTNKILLIDFGSGGFLVEEDELKYEGTRVYAPPEWIVSQRYRYEGVHIHVQGQFRTKIFSLFCLKLNCQG